MDKLDNWSETVIGKGLVRLLNQVSRDQGEEDLGWRHALIPLKDKEKNLAKNGLKVVIFRTVFKDFADSDNLDDPDSEVGPVFDSVSKRVNQSLDKNKNSKGGTGRGGNGGGGGVGLPGFDLGSLGLGGLGIGLPGVGAGPGFGVLSGPLSGLGIGSVGPPGMGPGGGLSDAVLVQCRPCPMPSLSELGQRWSFPEWDPVAG